MTRSVALSIPLTLVLALGVSGVLPAASSAAPVQDGATTDPGRNLELGIHYVLVAKGDLAASNLRAAMDAVADDAVLADLITEKGLDGRLEDAIRRGRLLPGVGEVIVELDARVDNGRIQLARDAARISAAVTALAGTGRQQVLARERLLAAGEYAIPALLTAALDASEPAVAAAARRMLVDEGRMAVAPLCAVLGGTADADTKKFAAQVLGEVAWPAAEPFLLQLAGNTEMPDDVRAAADQAYRRCGGGVGSAAEQFAQLARQYFDGLPSVVSYPRDQFNAIWNYEPTVGLLADSVPTPVFGSLMAMQTAARALAIDAGLSDALVTYVAADLRAANRAPEGFSAGERQYSPEFFARLAGMSTAAGVLDVALRSGDSPLALDAISAINEVGGAATIVAQQPTPLSAALTFGDRRVQFEAALSLAAANPRANFQNASLVVPTIASMIQTPGNPIGAIIADDEAARALGSDLSAGGFEPGAFANSFSQFASNSDAFGGTVDFVVIQGNRLFIERELASLQSSAAFSAVPILIVATAADLPSIDATVGDDIRCSATAAGAGADALHASLGDLLARATGGAFSADEAAAARDRAFEALTEIGTRAEGQFSLVDARRELITAVRGTDEMLAMQAAPVLALVPDPSAQVVLFDQAMVRSGDARIVFLYSVAESARRMGNFIDDKRVSALLGIVSAASGVEADAAGAAYGALNLPGAEAVQIITR